MKQTALAIRRVRLQGSNYSFFFFNKNHCTIVAKYSVQMITNQMGMINVNIGKSAVYFRLQYFSCLRKSAEKRL